MQRRLSKRLADVPVLPVHPDEVIDECRRRIEAIYPPTVQTVVLMAGGEHLERMRADIAALRARQEELLAMSPVPHQFRSDHYWRVPSVLGTAPTQIVTATPPPSPPAPPQVIVVQQPAAAPAAPQQPVVVQMVPPQQTAMPVPMPGLVAAAPYHPAAAVAPVAPVVHAPAGSSRHEPAPVPVPGAVTSPSVPVVQPRTTSAPAARPDPGIEVWDENAERLYQACKRALEGDGAAYKQVETLAKLERIPVRSFAERIVSERARTLEVFSRMQAAK